MPLAPRCALSLRTTQFLAGIAPPTFALLLRRVPSPPFTSTSGASLSLSQASLRLLQLLMLITPADTSLPPVIHDEVTPAPPLGGGRSGATRGRGHGKGSRGPGAKRARSDPNAEPQPPQHEPAMPVPVAVAAAVAPSSPPIFVEVTMQQLHTILVAIAVACEQLIASGNAGVLPPPLLRFTRAAAEAVASLYVSGFRAWCRMSRSGVAPGKLCIADDSVEAASMTPEASAPDDTADVELLTASDVRRGVVPATAATELHALASLYGWAVEAPENGPTTASTSAGASGDAAATGTAAPRIDVVRYESIDADTQAALNAAAAVATVAAVDGGHESPRPSVMPPVAVPVVGPSTAASRADATAATAHTPLSSISSARDAVTEWLTLANSIVSPSAVTPSAMASGAAPGDAPPAAPAADSAAAADASTTSFRAVLDCLPFDIAVVGGKPRGGAALTWRPHSAASAACGMCWALRMAADAQRLATYSNGHVTIAVVGKDDPLPVPWGIVSEGVGDAAAGGGEAGALASAASVAAAAAVGITAGQPVNGRRSTRSATGVGPNPHRMYRVLACSAVSTPQNLGFQLGQDSNVESLFGVVEWRLAHSGHRLAPEASLAANGVLLGDVLYARVGVGSAECWVAGTAGDSDRASSARKAATRQTQEKGFMGSRLANFAPAIAANRTKGPSSQVVTSLAESTGTGTKDEGPAGHREAISSDAIDVDADDADVAVALGAEGGAGSQEL